MQCIWALGCWFKPVGQTNLLGLTHGASLVRSGQAVPSSDCIPNYGKQVSLQQAVGPSSIRKSSPIVVAFGLDKQPSLADNLKFAFTREQE